ncbi:interferon beta-like [Lissotriton helveticus]
MASNTMARFTVVTGVLLLLCGGHVFCQKCGFSRHQQKKLNEDSLQLMEKMGGIFPRQCLSEKMSLKFPPKVMKANHQQTQRSLQLTIFNILHEVNKINEIMSKNLDTTGWDARSTDMFIQGLQRQTDVLAKCLSVDLEKKPNNFKKNKLKKYFKKMQNYIQGKMSSSCAWENIRQQLRLCLMNVDKLTSEMLRLEH